MERLNNVAGTAAVEAREGRIARAREILRGVDSLASRYDPLPLHTALFVAEAHAVAGDADRAMHWLDAYTPSGELYFQLHLRFAPMFDPIAGDARFRALLLRERPPAGQECGRRRATLHKGR